MKDAEAAGKETTEAKLTAFAKEAGYDVALEELQTFFKELEENKKGELSDSELDMVAGGKSQGWYVTSIATLGIGCAIGSIMSMGKDANSSCDQEIDHQLAGQM
jgi:hypothetical protein